MLQIKCLIAMHGWAKRFAIANQNQHRQEQQLQQRRVFCSLPCPPDLDKCFEIIKAATIEAGKTLMEAIQSKRSYTLQMDNFTTETDAKLEKFFVESITQHYPDHKFIAEESTHISRKACDLTNAPTWIIDPIDGTTNFIHGFPLCCTSVGFYVNRIAEIGIVYNPILKRMYTARRGQGAYCNEHKLQVSKCEKFSEALIIHEMGHLRKQKMQYMALDNTRNILPLVHGVRGLGSVALNMCYIAEGAADAYIHCGQHIWDVAAGTLIVLEAGGVVMDPSGNELDLLSRRMLCGCSRKLACELGAIWHTTEPKPRDDQPLAEIPCD